MTTSGGQIKRYKVMQYEQKRDCILFYYHICIASTALGSVEQRKSITNVNITIIINHFIYNIY